VKTRNLPTEEEILKKIREALDAKDYKKAAKIICYYAFAKIDPEEFAKGLLEAVERYKKEKRK